MSLTAKVSDPLRQLVSAILLCLAASGTVAKPHGTWEGVIEDQRRPIVLTVDFESGKARLDATGSAQHVMENLATGAGQVWFEIAVGEQRLRFKSKREGTQFEGTVAVNNRVVPFWLARVPQLTPSNRDEAWRQDLEAMVNRFLRYDRSFGEQARTAFRQAIDKLLRSVERKSDAEIMVELARAVALSGNAHTRLYLVRNRTEVRRLPIRAWWFKDELRVVRATAGHKDVLGCRITRVGNLDVLSAAERVRGIKPGNRSWQRYMSAYLLTSPEILLGAGIIEDTERVALTFACRQTERRLRLAPLPQKKRHTPTEAWWDLAPAYVDPDAGFLSALDRAKAPRYLSKPDEHYWFEYLADLNAIYFQFNRSQDKKDGETVQQFTERIARVVDERRPQALIVDVRFNSGGNLDLATPLVKTLSEKLRGMPVFVITGRATFSAGITHAVQWKQWASASIVGEEVGDELDFWSEGENLRLPNSKLTAHYSNAFHAYSQREYPRNRPYFLDLEVDSIAPNVLVEPTWEDYISGKDPVLEAVSRQIRRTLSRRQVAEGVGVGRR